MEVKVTRKGQVTVPIGLRKKYRIVEGMKMAVEDSPTGIIFKVIPRIEDLAGIDAGKIKMEDALKALDKMRSED
jgi:bifunctional DNA-binding transcriptional regulator/antitoxin component of YhaV-PrlF toxin-antitoxin module